MSWHDDEEEDYRGRTDGLTARQEIQMLGRITRGAEGKRWLGGSERRRKAVAVVDRVLGNDSLHPIVQLKAVDLALKMEQQNMIDERMDDIENKGGGGEKVILILPPNGSEVG
jgi:superfamily II DNA or RNA helicase